MRLFLEEMRKIRRIFRADPKPILAGIIAPTAILVVFALTFGSFKPFPVSVVNHDRGPLGEALQQEILGQISPLGAIPYFRNAEPDQEAAMRKYQAGQLLGVIVIPEDFTDKFQAAQGPKIVYYFNNYNTDLAKNLRLYLQEGVLSFYRQYQPAVAVEVKEVYTVNRQVEWFDIIATGVLLLATVLGGMFNFLYMLFKERQYGTLLEYRLAPRSPSPSFWARVVFALLMSAITGAVNGVLVYLMTGMDLWAHLGHILPPLVLVSLCYIFSSAVFSLYAGTFAGAAVGSMVGALLLWFMSGGITSAKYATGIINTLSYQIPNRYALSIIRDAVFADQIEQLATNYLILAAFTLVSMTVALASYRRKMWSSL